MHHATPSIRVLTVAAALTLPVLLAAPASAASDTSPKVTKCFGKKPTFVVTGRKARLTLRPAVRNAVVELLGKGESVNASKARGNTLVCDLGGATSIVTGSGGDKVSISGGSPTVTTGGGNDTFIQTGTGNPTVHLGAGNDTATLFKGNGTVYGDDGNDTLRAGKGTTGRGGRQRLTGGRGTDRLFSGAATSTLDGSDGGNIFTVAAHDASHTTLVLHAGDRVNGLLYGVVATPPAPVAVPPAPGPVPVPAPPVAIPVPLPTGTLAVTNTAGSPVQNVPNDKVTHLDLAGTPAAGRSVIGWSLDFGDGSPVHSGLGLPPSVVDHTYYVVGAYTAALALTDDLGRVTVVATAPVSAGAEPSAAFVPTVSGTTVAGSFDGGPGAGSGYVTTLVDYGDGTTKSFPGAPTFGHTYAYGHYGIKVTVTNDHGGSKSVVNYVNVTDSAGHATLVFTGLSGITGKGPGYTTVGSTNLSIDAGRSVGYAGKPLASETLDDGDGNGAVAGSFAVPQYTTSGTKTVTLSFSSQGTTYTATDKVYVASAATQAATIDNLPATASVGQPVSFTTTAYPGIAPSGAPHADALNARTMTFDSASDDGTAIDVGSAATTAPITHTFTVPGVYDVETSATDTYGDLHNAYATIVVTSGGPSIQEFATTTQGASTPWLGQPLSSSLNYELVAIGGPGHATDGHYTLDYGDGSTPATGGFSNSGTATVSSHTYAQAGEYTSTLTFTDGGGASVVTTMHVSVTPAPTVSLAGVPVSSASGLTVTIAAKSYAAGTVGDHWTVTVGGSDDSSYSLSGNGAVPGSVTFAPGQYGGTAPYAASVTIYDDHGGKGNDYKNP